MEEIESLCKKIPESEQMLAIKGIGIITVAGFLAEIGDARRFESPRQIQKLAGLSLRENSSGKHKGQTTTDSVEGTTVNFKKTCPPTGAERNGKT